MSESRSHLLTRDQVVDVILEQFDMRLSNAGDDVHLLLFSRFEAEAVRAALSDYRRSETTHNEIVEKCAKAIAKRTQELCSDPEVCYTEHDTGATIINSRYSDHVEALDEAEAIVRALKVPTESERSKANERSAEA